VPRGCLHLLDPRGELLQPRLIAPSHRSRALTNRFDLLTHDSRIWKLPQVTRRGADDVVAWLQTEDAIDATVVRRTAVSATQGALTVLPDIPQRAHLDARNRVAVLVEHHAREDTAARQLQARVELLSVTELNGRARQS